MDKNLFDLGLPKWPELRVIGEKVSLEEAEQIIIRCSGLNFWCNDKEWSNTLFNIIGDSFPYLGESSEYRWLDFDYLELVRSKINCLNLEYLSISQIASSYVGGPYGWVDWDGNVQTFGYNIGKWPSVDEVYSDWKQIAEAFPFLSLRAQLMSGEAGEESIPLVEFVVKDGSVEAVAPQKELLKPAGTKPPMSFSQRFSDPYAERGCSEAKFKKAFEATL